MAVFLTSIQSVLSIVIMIGVGYVCQALGWFKESFSKSISQLIMKVALPCSIFASMLEFFHPSQLSKLAVGLVYVILAIAIGYVLAFVEVNVFKVKKGRCGLMMTAINGANTVFIGLPLNVALFGSVSIPYLLVYYIVNTVVIWTVGVWVIAADDPNGGKAKFDWHHLIPAPLWGFIVALPFIYIPWLQSHLYLKFVQTAVTGLGGLVTPLALIYIGIMLKNFGFKAMTWDKDVVLTLIGRFVVSPIIMVAIIFIGFKIGTGLLPKSMFAKTLIVQSATPALAVLPIMADQYHGDVKFATNVVVQTSVLFIIVVPIIMVLTQFL